MLARINKDQLGDSSEESSSIVYDHIPLWNELMLAGKTGAGMVCNLNLKINVCKNN